MMWVPHDHIAIEPLWAWFMLEALSITTELPQFLAFVIDLMSCQIREDKRNKAHRLASNSIYFSTTFIAPNTSNVNFLLCPVHLAVCWYVIHPYLQLRILFHLKQVSFCIVVPDWCYFLFFYSVPVFWTQLCLSFYSNQLVHTYCVGGSICSTNSNSVCY